MAHLSNHPVNIGRISYLNVAPVYYGLDNGPTPSWVRLFSAPPSVLNREMAAGRLDISPVSTAALARPGNDWMVLPDLCIACDGPVMSVLLAGRFPMDALDGKTVYLTEDSASAAALLKLVLAEEKITPVYRTARFRSPGDLPADAAGALVIGDAALTGGWHRHCAHVTDLGTLWKQRTGLPFVFAVWAVRAGFARNAPDRTGAVHALFRRSCESGLANLSALAQSAGPGPEVMSAYYRRLGYRLGARQTLGLDRFYHGLFRHGFLDSPFRPAYFQPEALAAPVRRRA